MKCNTMPELMVSFLYDELEPGERKKVKLHLASCDSCRSEYNELEESTSILEKWKDKEPHLNFIFINEKDSFTNKMRQFFRRLSATRKFVYALPVAACVVLLLLSIFNFRASNENGNWSLSFSLLPQKQSSTLSGEFTQQIEQRNQQTMKLVQDMITASENRQNLLHQQNMGQLAREIRQQRKKDLQMVGYGLEGLQYSTEGRFKKTNQLIGDLMHLTGYSMEKK